MLGTVGVGQTGAGGGPGVLPREILGFLGSSRPRVDLNQFYHVFYLHFFL